MSVAVGPLGRNGEASGALSAGGKVAAMYSYSKTKGLFGGVSIEGSVIVERQDANAQAYRSDVTAKQLLSGAIPPPEWAQPLIKTLEICTGLPGTRKWVNDEHMSPGGYAFGGLESPKNEAPSGLFSPFGKKKKGSTPFPPASWGRKKSQGSYFSSEFQDDDDFGRRRSDESEGIPPEPTYSSTRPREGSDPTAHFDTHFDSDFLANDPAPKKHPHLTVSPDHTSTTATDDSFRPRTPYDSMSSFGDTGRSRMASNLMTHNRSFSSGAALTPRSVSSPLGKSHTPQSLSDPFALASAYASGTNASNSSLLSDDLNVSTPSSKPIRPLRVKPELSTPLQEGVGRCIALYDFDAVQPGDLSFKQGDVITILEKSGSTDTWWKGKLNGREGIFPANRVELV